MKTKKTEKNKKRAFTLAETMIVLIVLGVIAAITIPALVRRQIESAERTKIKKAMTVYDLALNKMVIENNIKSNGDLQDFAPENTCTKTSPYFKGVENVDNNICKFKTSDGVWWDISDIQHPIVALSKDYLTSATADGNTNKAFRFVGHFDDNTGILRVDDAQYEKGAEHATELGYLTKLYNFVKPEVGGATDTNNVTTIRPYKSCSSGGYCNFYDMYGNRIGYGSKCPSNATSVSDCTGTKSYGKVDENGRLVADSCNASLTSCNYYYKYDDSGHQIATCYDEEFTECDYSKYDGSGNMIGRECNESLTECVFYHKYDGSGNMIADCWDEELTGCDTYYKYDDSGNQIAYCSDEALTDCGTYYKYDDSGHQIALCYDAEYTDCYTTYTITYTD